MAGARHWVMTASALALAACLPFASPVHDEALVGPYRLFAADADEQMSICRSVPGSDDCFGDGLPGPTIFAAGGDDRYLVAARHPYGAFDDQSMNRGVTEYYYIERLPGDGGAGTANDRTIGPLTGRQFLHARAKLGLPPFTRLFDELH